jgi:anti-sigma regulatory factor (Ser/Thr protein kinase)
MASPRQNPAVREFILRNVRTHPADIAAVTAARYELSRPAVAGYIKRLINEGLIDATGSTRDRRYKAHDLVLVDFEVRLTPGLSENAIWQARVIPHIKDVPENVINICQYGFTEMFNNTVDHSASYFAHVIYRQTYAHINMQVLDTGIGIFQKLQNQFHLHDPRQALLELSKGRLTSDPTHHTGHGIFFTSRMFDEFSIYSGNLLYNRIRQEDDDWLVEGRDLPENVAGTRVEMTISTNATWTTRDVFDRYQDDPVGFRRTHVPIALGKYPGEQLVSRSQAKRVLARVDRFSEVLLDFQGVQDIGPAFADEIFRVFRNAHPDIAIVAVRANERVTRMINVAREAQITPPTPEQLSFL